VLVIHDVVSVIIVLHQGIILFFLPLLKILIDIEQRWFMENVTLSGVIWSSVVFNCKNSEGFVL